MAANYYASGQVEAPFGAYDTINSFGANLGPQADPRSLYTPEQLAYLDSLSAYTTDQQAQGYNVDPLRQFKTFAPIRDRREDFGATEGSLGVDNFQRPRGQQRYLTQDELQSQIEAAQAFSPDIADRFGTNIYGGENAQTRVSYADQPFQLYNKGKLVFEGQGRDDARTDYYKDPVEPALVFAQAGAAWIHVVDLDGAFGGAPLNLPILQRIAALGPKIQFGGGMRDRGCAEPHRGEEELAATVRAHAVATSAAGASSAT